jgi:hypothetical protein
MIERPHQKWWGFFMSTRITEFTRSFRIWWMLFGKKPLIIFAKQYFTGLRGKMILNKTLTIIS